MKSREPIISKLIEFIISVKEVYLIWKKGIQILGGDLNGLF